MSIGALALLVTGLLASTAHAQRDAVIAFVDSKDAFERFAERQELAVGLMSATQGAYTVRQTLIDMSAGSRTSRSTYEPELIPLFGLRSTGTIQGWDDVIARAETAFADIRPGLLAERLGGAAYVGVEPEIESALAADRDGNLAELALGSRATLPERVLAAARRHRLVVTVLPGPRVLDEVLAGRPDDLLVIAIKRPPRVLSPQLLPTGVAGLSDTPGLLRSPTTRHKGLVAAIDVLPTLTGSDEGVTGRAMFVEPGRDVDGLASFEKRLFVVYPRRFPALFAVVLSLLLTTLALRYAGRERQAARVCALAVLWVPAVALLAAQLAPPRYGELALMGAGTVVLGLATDRFVPWPRGPAVPALVGVVAYALDLAVDSKLTIQSLLGPNPRFGSRFYGVGNELEATLPVLLLVGLAAALALPAGRALAVRFGIAMLALGAILGSGRFGADVGGVITAGAGGAAAVLVALGRRPGRLALAIACAVPALALGALAVLDLTTGGDSHFSRLLGGNSGDFGDTVLRRYSLAWNALIRGLMPVATAGAIVLLVVAYRRRQQWYGHLGPAWWAALVGGAAGGIVGTLTNDSGPVLLVLGVVVLGAATVYVRNPRLRGP